MIADSLDPILVDPPHSEGDLSFLCGADLTPENDPTHPDGRAERSFPTREETSRYIASVLEEPYVEPDPLDSHQAPTEVRNWRTQS